MSVCVCVCVFACISAFACLVVIFGMNDRNRGTLTLISVKIMWHFNEKRNIVTKKKS